MLKQYSPCPLPVLPSISFNAVYNLSDPSKPGRQGLLAFARGVCRHLVPRVLSSVGTWSLEDVARLNRVNLNFKISKPRMTPF